MSVSTSEESERRLAEAMRAQATGVGRPGFVGRNPGSLGAPPGPPNGPYGGPAGAAGQRFTSGGWSASAARAQPVEHPQPLWAAIASSRLALLLALVGGVVLGVALALLSLLVPGALPPLG